MLQRSMLLGYRQLPNPESSLIIFQTRISILKNDVVVFVGAGPEVIWSRVHMWEVTMVIGLCAVECCIMGFCCLHDSIHIFYHKLGNYNKDHMNNYNNMI